MEKAIDISKLNHALELLNEQLILSDSPQTEIVVCGGSALIALSLVPRTTQDVDIVAMMKDGVLADPEPLPDYLVKAATQVGRIMNLPNDWLNNGPGAISGSSVLQYQFALLCRSRSQNCRLYSGRPWTVGNLRRLCQPYPEKAG